MVGQGVQDEVEMWEAEKRLLLGKMEWGHPCDMWGAFQQVARNTC